MPSAQRHHSSEVQGGGFRQAQGDYLPHESPKDALLEKGAYAKDEKILMHFFQESLAGAVITWYTNLESSWVRSWKDLIISFIKQYQYNSDMAPDRMQLQNMCKREHESFKEYAQRWRDLVAQVAPVNYAGFDDAKV